MKEKTSVPVAAPVRRAGRPYALVVLFALVVGAGTFWLSLEWAHSPKDTSVVLSGLGFIVGFILANSGFSYLESRGVEELALLFSSSTQALNRSSAFLHGRGVIKSTRTAESHYAVAISGFRRVAQESVSAELCRSSASALETLAKPDGYMAGSPCKFNDLRPVAEAYLRSALLGSRPSQHKVASLYQEGLGMDTDLIEAYAWFNIAAAGGSVEAERSREFIATRLTSGDVTQAQKRSLELLAMVNGKA
jgi:TPR repeat protein